MGNNVGQCSYGLHCIRKSQRDLGWNISVKGTRVVSFTKEINSKLDKGPLVFKGRLANRSLTSLVKEAIVVVALNW